MARCLESGRYLALSAPFVGALARVLRSLGDAPVLEICAGEGALARALEMYDVSIRPTDASPPASAAASVERLTAHEALALHRPRVVLGSFVPWDAGVDRCVLSDANVRHYVVLGARLGGTLGSGCLWTVDGWTRTPLAEVTRWMVSRHDVWLGDDRPLLGHGEAWLLSRTGLAAPGSPPSAEQEPWM